MMTASILLKSCAMPPAIWPIDFHLLHLPHLLLGGVAFGHGVLQGAIGESQLARGSPRIGDPVGEGRTGEGDGQHDRERKQGNGPTRGRLTCLQQRFLGLLQALKSLAQVLHECEAAAFHDQVERAS